MNKKVAIIGNGWVGKGMQELFPDALIYVRDIAKLQDNDINRKIANKYSYTDNKDLINQCDIAFICVPTPNDLIEVTHERLTKPAITIPAGKGKLDTSAVEECIAWCTCSLTVVRSTVNPGDCYRWEIKYHRKIVMQPEYLGETPQHPLLDTKETPFLIIGGHPNYRRTLIELYQEVYNANISIRQVTLKEAEIIKLTENRAIAFKVAQCQELYDVCEKAGVDYYTIRDAVYGDDPRFNLWWTFVYPDKRGFNSKCIPKDIYAWCAWAESLGYTPKITRAILEKNKEWINDKL